MSHNIFTSLFSVTFPRICTYHYYFILDYTSHILSHIQCTIFATNALFLQHYQVFFYTPFVSLFHIYSLYEISFCFLFYALYTVLLILCYCLFLSCTQQSFRFSFQIGHSQSAPCFSLICYLRHFSYKLSVHSFNLPHFFLFHSPKFS